ncbi:MAG: YeeE/YedE family protein [Vicinamibacteria bacterium]|nr:YeeE/YedE family protein [Vicinamibacteria bacterium]
MHNSEVTRPAIGTAEARPVNAMALTLALGLAVSAVMGVGLAVSARQASLMLVGLLAGVTLYHAAFGFTTAFRLFAVEGRGAGVRAQMLMLGLTALVFIPLIGAGQPVLGQSLRGAVAPLGVALLIGAFLFGVGMQLGGGCASGTLYSAGGGNVRMGVTLAGFIAGSLIGTAHAPWWERVPSMPGVSMIATTGIVGALAITAFLLGGVVLASRAIERRRHGDLIDDQWRRTHGRRWWLQGPWPLVLGAVGLALVNIATLVIAGRPWGVTGAFALWGAKAALALGVDVAAWPFWQAPARAATLAAPVVADVTSVMNVGIIMGAWIAAALAGRFAPGWRTPLPSLAAAVIGGLLLGYGARLASGCNIGAYFSGVASASLHGYVWFLAALGGTVVGARLRPLFGLGV